MTKTMTYIKCFVVFLPTGPTLNQGEKEKQRAYKTLQPNSPSQPHLGLETDPTPVWQVVKGLERREKRHKLIGSQDTVSHSGDSRQPCVRCAGEQKSEWPTADVIFHLDVLCLEMLPWFFAMQLGPSPWTSGVVSEPGRKGVAHCLPPPPGPGTCQADTWHSDTACPTSEIWGSLPPRECPGGLGALALHVCIQSDVLSYSQGDSLPQLKKILSDLNRFSCQSI